MFGKIWKKKDKDGEETIRWGRVICTVAVCVFLLTISVCNLKVIPAGHKGVVMTSPFGASTTEVNEGWSWQPYYFVSDIQVINYQRQVIEFIGSDARDDDMGSISVITQDSVPIFMDISLIYCLPADKVADITIEIQNYRGIINQYTRSIPRDLASEYNALDIISLKRGEFQSKVAFNVTEKLKTYNIIVEDFKVRDIRLPAVMENAIVLKKSAEQDMIRADYERQTKIIQADAEKQAQIISAEGTRNATIIKAAGQAQAIQIIMEQLGVNNTNMNETNVFLQWLYIQALTDPNTHIQYVIIPTESGIPILLNLAYNQTET